MLALQIAGGVCLLITILLISPVSLRFSYAGEKVALKAYYLFLRFDLSPGAVMEMVENKSVLYKNPKKAEKIKRKDAKVSEERKLLDTIRILGDLLGSAGGPWKLLRKHIVFYKVGLYMLIGGEDAHQTALRYAAFSYSVFALVYAVAEAFVLRDPVIFLSPDFSGAKSRYDISLRLRIRPVFALAAGLGLLRRFISRQRERNPNKVKGGKKHEPTTSRK